jgi:hypothetical protein
MGQLDPCDHCATTNSHQSKLNKHIESCSKTSGERLFSDISSVKGLSYGNSKFWLLDQDWSKLLTAESHTAT